MAVTDQAAFETGTEAVNARDLDRFSECLADDLVFHAPGVTSAGGKAACLEFYRSLFEAFPDAHLEVRRLHVLDDVAVEEGTLTGTHDGFARTGRSVALDFVQVLRFRDGKHVSLTLMLDRLLLLEQLGLVADTASAR